MFPRLLVVPILLGGMVMVQTPSMGGERIELPHGRAALQWASPSADTVPARRDSVREYRGRYETGFEVSWFHPCDAEPDDDTWWVTLTDDALRQRDSLARLLTGRPQPLIVRWRGTVSPKMPMGAGHMGRGSRYMLVTEIVSMGVSDDKECASRVRDPRTAFERGARRVS